MKKLAVVLVIGTLVLMSGNALSDTDPQPWEDTRCQSWRIGLIKRPAESSLMCFKDTKFDKKRRLRPLSRRVLTERLLKLDEQVLELERRLNDLTIWKENNSNVWEFAKRLSHIEWQIKLVLPSCEDTADVWRAICVDWPEGTE